ncbi:MAG: hypothetical protein ACKVJX_20795 [Verrucomicrobiia bacterium]|jgi:hypothetical protein
MKEKMTDEAPKVSQVVERLFESFGGKAKFFEITEKRLAEFNAHWNQDVGAIGRVLRAHLIVEHYLTAYLQGANPKLGDLDDAKVGFAKKVDLLGNTNSLFSSLVPGIRRLNTVRNRLAHNLSVSVTTDDVNSFRSVEYYWAMRTASEKGHESLSMEPMHVYEHFAKFVAGLFHHSASDEVDKWRDAINGE